MANTILIIMAAVFLITIAFSVMIVMQFGQFEKKAREAKQRKELYLEELKNNYLFMQRLKNTEMPEGLESSVEPQK